MSIAARVEAIPHVVRHPFEPADGFKDRRLVCCAKQSILATPEASKPGRIHTISALLGSGHGWPLHTGQEPRVQAIFPDFRHQVP